MTQPLSINLTDPRVQDMLGAPRVASHKARQVVQLAGDVPDPTAQTGHLGIQCTQQMTAGKQEVVVVYKDLLMTVDVYAVPGEPVTVHLYCPKCRKHATVKGSMKAIDFDPGAGNPMYREILSRGELGPEVLAVAAIGRISIEAFECPWEMGDAAHVRGGVHTGASLCRQRLVIEDNRARDA